MRAQRHGLGVPGLKPRDELRPQRACRAHLGDLHEEVLPLRPEEREPRRERVDVDARLQTGAHVLETVGQGVSHLQVGRRPRLLHVVARDGDGIELRHRPRGEGEDVRNDPHRGRWRVDVRVADHVLLEDVVLNRPRELIESHALLLGRDDVEGHHRQHGAVHGHRHRDAVERDAVEQHFHVQHRVHRHAGFADIGEGARMVGVVAAVRGQVEGHRQPLLARRDVAPVERIRILGGREAGVLAHGPGSRDIHRPVGAPNEGRQSRQGVEMLAGGEIRSVVDQPNVDLLQRALDPVGRRPSRFDMHRSLPVGARGA